MMKNPYPGLRSFGTDEGPVFFGRERQLDELLRKIRSNRFLAVVGTSGSGKSSLAKASLAPRLKNGFAGQGGNNWRIAVCAPGSNPIENLSKQLAQRGVLHSNQMMDPNYPAVIETLLRRGSLGIVEAFKQSDVQRGDNLMVVVDQFEEIFRYSKKGPKEQEEASAFVNLLLNASRQKDTPIYIVLTMRSEFIGACTEFRGLPEAINDGQFLIPRMKVEDLKRAIIAPIESPDSKKVTQTNCQVERELVNRIISDLGDDYDQLSAMQHVLMRTWDQWRSENTEDDPTLPITVAHYETVGTLHSALSMHINATYNRLKDPKDKAVCERMFKALCEKGADGKFKRRPVTVKEIMDVSEADFKTVRRVVTNFSEPGREFLSAPAFADLDEDSIINLTHECIMERWELLNAWIKSETESAEIYVRMAAAAALFYQKKGSLWRDPELTMGLKWYNPKEYDAEHPDRLAPNASWAARYHPGFFETIEFLKESLDKHNKRLDAERAEHEGRIRRNQRFAIFGMVVAIFCIAMLIFSTIAGKRAWDKAQEAQRNEELAIRAQYLAELSKQDALESKEQALMSQNVTKKAEDEATRSTIEALLANNEADRQLGIARDKEQLAKDKAALAELEAARAKKAQEETKSALEKAEVAKDEAQRATKDAIRQKGLSLAQTMAVKSSQIEDDNIKGLLAKEAYELNQANKGKNYDSYIYTGVYRAVAELQKEVNNNRNFNRLSGKPEGYGRIGAIRGLKVSHDKKFIYTAGSEGLLLEWTMPTDLFDKSKGENKMAPTRLKKRSSGVDRALALSPNGQYLVRGGDDREVEVVDLTSADKNSWNLDMGGLVWAIEFLPNSQGMIVAVQKYKTDNSGNPKRVNSLEFVDISTKERAPLKDIAHANQVNELTISEDGRYLAVATSSKGVYFFDLADKKEIGNDVLKTETTGAGSTSNRKDLIVTSVDIGGIDDRFVAAGYQDGSVRIWDLKKIIRGENPIPEKLKYHNISISDLEFSKDGTMLAVGSLDCTASIWRIIDEVALRNGEPENNIFPYKNSKFLPIKLESHGKGNWVTSVTFTDDGKQMLSGTKHGTIHVWETDLSVYGEQICPMIGRNLSDRSWEKYIGTDDLSGRSLYINTFDGERRNPFKTCLKDDGTSHPQMVD